MISLLIVTIMCVYIIRRERLAYLEAKKKADKYD